MKDRKIADVDISKGFPVYRFKAFFLDRLRAEGVSEVEVTIDDDTCEISIKPKRPV
jgi:ribosomal protein S3